jgi:ubiquinone/menaquinone biosynthesis C-methylase UbiE
MRDTASATTSSIRPMILARAEGCGDPTPYLRAGETVLALGSGAGKLCFRASQVVGPTGWVIGIEPSDDLLAIARRHAREVARRLGYANVEFRKASLRDLRLDREWLDRLLREHPVGSEADLVHLQAAIAASCRTLPLVSDESVDAVVSNCVPHLVEPMDMRRLAGEIFRILRPGGRAIITEIPRDDTFVEADPERIADREKVFRHRLAEAGFQDVTVLDGPAGTRRRLPGTELRSVTVAAYKRRRHELQHDVPAPRTALAASGAA